MVMCLEGYHWRFPPRIILATVVIIALFEVTLTSSLTIPTDETGGAQQSTTARPSKSRRYNKRRIVFPGQNQDKVLTAMSQIGEGYHRIRTTRPPFSPRPSNRGGTSTPKISPAPRPPGVLGPGSHHRGGGCVSDDPSGCNDPGEYLTVKPIQTVPDQPFGWANVHISNLRTEGSMKTALGIWNDSLFCNSNREMKAYQLFFTREVYCNDSRKRQHVYINKFLLPISESDVITFQVTSSKRWLFLSSVADSMDNMAITSRCWFAF
jgi:hypothetical protein